MIIFQIQSISIKSDLSIFTPGESHAGKINGKDVELFRNRLVQEFYRLKALITLEQVNTSVIEKKKNLRPRPHEDDCKRKR